MNSRAFLTPAEMYHADALAVKAGVPGFVDASRITVPRRMS